MGALMRSLDWAQTPLGPVEQWPQSLRTSVSTCLNSRFAILIWWGPDLVMLYNDAYRDIIASKHPAALGHPGRACWPEIWHIIGPMLSGVLHCGEATWSNDLLLLLERNGYAEECYFTFSYSPIRDESGGIGGVFTPVVETTDHVIAERRLHTLRELAARAGRTHDVTAACAAAIATLRDNPYDIPCAALYLFDEDRVQADLMGTTGLPADWAHVPDLSLNDSRLIELHDLGPLPGGAWDTPAQSAVVVPLLLPGLTAPAGFLLAGVSPRKRLDPNYRTFFELAAGQISSAIAGARAYQDERRRAEALAEIDRAKTTFFSNISHEFRTPLTLMLGPLEAMMQRPGNPPPAPGELRMVHRNAMRLLKLVNTLLDFSRIEAGRVEALYLPTDLAASTTDIASAFHSAMDSAGLQYRIDCPPLDEPVYVDRDMWEKIILNLVSNAFKFTLSGSIGVRLRSLDKTIELAVHDTGTGIPPDQLPHIFERFHRIQGARGRTHEGSGIGLALVHELVKLHGGSIRVESVPGQGSTFIVSIPKGSAHLPPERLGQPRTVSSAGASAPAYVEEALRWLPDAERPLEKFPLFAADSVQAPHVQNGIARILLADDNADMREYVRRLLGETYQVEAVANGDEALAAALRHPPDLVLTDVMMPRMDGFALLRELRAAESTRTIPVILLSARAGEDARIEGMKAGADDYMVKPFTARELLARVGAHLAMSRLRSEAADRERALRAEAGAAQERAAKILESLSDGFLSVDWNWRFTYINREAERTLVRDEVIGRSLWDIFPMVIGSDLEKQYRRSMTERIPTHIEYLYPPWQRWFEIRIYPAADGGLSIFYQDITQRKLDEDAMRKTNEALRIANADLEQFAYSASHDLREPLRMIRSFCQLLSRSYMGKLDAEADQMIQYCVEGAARMDALLNGLLAYLRAPAPLDQVYPPAPLDAALDAALLNLRSAIGGTPETAEIAESAATITRDPLPALPIAPVHAQQIFQNLIGNALKYHGPAPPVIHIGARREDAAWIFSVRDNGIGIDPAFSSQVFGLFKRLHSAPEYSGTGIGLAICKKLVERYRGRIWVESQVGQGSTFFFSIPTDTGAPPPAQ
jgi:PAS domain S-box-containing protein